MNAVGERLRRTAVRAVAAPDSADALCAARVAAIVDECAEALAQLQRELPLQCE